MTPEMQKAFAALIVAATAFCLFIWARSTHASPKPPSPAAEALQAVALLESQQGNEISGLRVVSLRYPLPGEAVADVTFETSATRGDVIVHLRLSPWTVVGVG